ncbi:glycosyltransferase family 2 protein [Ruminococcus sp.]|jgi:glycosyltransferase involved in cell wall biosynthesis|uniref:glycosyltransferase family 2 protein n=1 Tax=Ruminococcus sp. TaxID=41978 RepID=UPI0025F0255C|nr:glycosyltransferase family 2 protein [Ruminococcus sp.]
MKEALISVIIPIFRVEKYLRRCIDSIINQTYRNIEIILVDDGSDDGCPSICDEYVNLDNRVFVYHKNNGGLSDARNYGIKKSNGEYLLFVDSDDYVDLTMIQKLYIALIKNNADISICPYLYVNENGEMLQVQKKLGKRGTFSNEEIFHMYDVSDVSWILGVAWNKLYKREIFSDIRYPVGKLHEDNFVSFLLYEKANLISIIDDKLYFYTQREQSIMGNRVNVRHADGAIAALNRIDFAKKTGRLYLIPKAEEQAFGTLFSIVVYVNNNKDRRYLRPIIKRYTETYEKSLKYLNLSAVEKIKRRIFIRSSVMLYLYKLFVVFRNKTLRN